MSNLDDKFNAPPPAPPVEITREDILAALKFSAPREVRTKVGPRIVKNAPLTDAFWQLYNGPERESLRAAGYTVSKDFHGEWQVAHWSLVPEPIRIKREEATKLSRATDAEINAPCPEGLSYLGYQRAGIAFGYDRKAVLIGDEMGLGKTIQAIGIVNCMAPADAKKILVICPASLKLNWKRELEKWLVQKRTVFVADSKILPDLEGVVIVNYEVLHKHTETIHTIDYDVLIVDEAHYLKSGGKTRRGKMVLGYDPSKKEQEKGAASSPGIYAKKRIFLTGTPIANRPAELFPLINYLDPDRWPNFFKYALRYCAAYKEFHGGRSHWDFSGHSHLDELQEILRETIMVRRLKKDVLTELPPKRRQVIELPADGEAKRAVKRELEAYEQIGTGIDEAEAEMELAEASDNPDDYRKAVEKLKAAQKSAFEGLSTLRRETAESKIPAVIEHLRDAVEESGKVIAFAHHKSVVQAIAKEFGAEAVSLVGDTPMAERQANVDRFQTDPGCKLFIGSIGAAGVGITLTAAAHVVFAELDWVPGNVSQAEDRAHRIGQRESVLIQHLVLEDSLDAVIAKRIIAKQEIIDQALDNQKAKLAEDPVKEPRAGRTKLALEDEAAKMTASQRWAAHECIKRIASMCNGARDWDGMGFSKIDTHIGKSLAAQQFITPKQAALCFKIARKYRRQLPERLYVSMIGGPSDENYKQTPTTNE